MTTLVALLLAVSTAAPRPGPKAPPPKPLTCEEQAAEHLVSGATQTAVGAAFVVPGSFALLGGIAGLATAGDAEGATTPPLVTLLAGVIFMAIGGPLMSSGRQHTRDGALMDCTPVSPEPTAPVAPVPDLPVVPSPEG